jgi:hypothetical protein
MSSAGEGTVVDRNKRRGEGEATHNKEDITYIDFQGISSPDSPSLQSDKERAPLLRELQKEKEKKWGVRTI